ncbi:MAG TPA: ATP-binding protein [Pyrinomonadaceae bacterium]|jgi:two-component system chemotaxis sensor kinase CheA|nr:ATP-binding protein [Pyrinomonadaceae bacterium]
MDQTQHEFLVDIEELIEHIFVDLDELRAISADGRSRRELIDRVFRRVHSVKGSAASCRLDIVSQIAHEFENLLDEVRSGRVLIDEDLLDTCESATDALSESLSLAASGKLESSPRALFGRLQAAARNTSEPGSGGEGILRNVPFEIWESLTEAEKQRLIIVAAEGSPLFVITTSFAIENFDSQFFRLKEKLAEFGEVISTSPAVDDEHPDRINFRVLYAGDGDAQPIAAFSSVAVTKIADAATERPEKNKPESAAPAETSSLSNFVRIDLDKLDHLISSTHELLRTTSSAMDLALAVALPQPPAGAELQNLHDQIRGSFRSVEEQLIHLRLVTVGPVLQRAMRAGRASARLAGKEVDFEIRGGELRLDKLLVEAIADPLIHLVRNAVDHGIETAEERAQAGKPARGNVRIEVVSEGSQSRLRVTDDGRGVDPAVISAAASRLGLLPAEGEPLDVDRSLRLIFRPGFTTLASASNISGRGVGLDVVETSVEQVGGELRVSSKPREGTKFEIRLPVTFGLIAANVVVSNGNHYCIPATQTLGIDAIDIVDGTSGADRLRQYSLRDLLGQPEEPDDASSQLHLITCQFTDDRAGISNQQLKCVGIVVDRVEGPQEVLVRKLGRHAGRWYGIAGAAELRDGSVALVLDLPRLLSSGS